ILEPSVFQIHRRRATRNAVGAEALTGFGAYECKRASSHYRNVMAAFARKPNELERTALETTDLPEGICSLNSEIARVNSPGLQRRVAVTAQRCGPLAFRA